MLKVTYAKEAYLSSAAISDKIHLYQCFLQNSSNIRHRISVQLCLPE